MINLIHGDCLDIMAGMEPDTFDVAVTSPPYNMGIDYGLYDDDMEESVYLLWLRQVSEHIHRVTTRGASFFLNIGYNPTDPTFPFRVISHLECPWKVQNVIHWIKAISVDGKGSWGHYKPVNSRRFLNQTHEYVFHLTKTGEVPVDRLALGVPYQDTSNAKRWASAEGKNVRCRGNCWFIPYKTITSRDKDRPHPATFPPLLAEWCIRLHKGASNVLDPFVGIGSTMLAAEKLGLRGVGIDVDAGYLKVAEGRVEKLRQGIDTTGVGVV